MRSVQHIGGVLLAALLLGGCPSPHVPPPKPHASPNVQKIQSPSRVSEDFPSVGADDVVPSPVPAGTDDQLSSTASGLKQQAEADHMVQEVICYAYQTFYDAATEQFSVPDEATFAVQTATALSRRGSSLDYYSKANSVHSALASLQTGDFVDLATTLVCI